MSAPINSLTIKTGSSRLISVILLDQNSENIIPSNENYVIADSTIVEVKRSIDNWTQVQLKALKAGTTTVTFTAKGIVKVLTVVVVDPIPTSINIYEDAYDGTI